MRNRIGLPTLNRRALLRSLAAAFFLPAQARAPHNRAEWQQARAATLAAMQRVMGALPPRAKQAVEMETLEREDLSAFTRTKICYLSEPGDWVPAYLLVPKRPKRHAPAMLCLHQTVKIGKAEPAGLGGNPELHYAQELAERGFVCLAPDYPYLGENSFDPYQHGYASCTMKGIVNHMRAVDLLQSLPQVNAQRLGVIGHSLGGHNALFVAAFDERLKAIVTSCGFTSFGKYYGGDLTGWSGVRYMPRIAEQFGKDSALMPFDFPDVLAALAPRPLFINAPLRDANFEVNGVRDCVAAAQPVYEKVFRVGGRLQAVYPDAAHSFPDEQRAQAYAFLERWLRR
ncbi:MAG: alpha/beta fold hydrolase [Acidobacteria bacterium]|nr:alpha/beta fold hydrolase [Acidobacteriota bacterium]MBI3424767.1 alpha/beta fold hydrolase [Acidobacteriota bacterium]